jgi:hypothetical protein
MATLFDPAEQSVAFVVVDGLHCDCGRVARLRIMLVGKNAQRLALRCVPIRFPHMAGSQSLICCDLRQGCADLHTGASNQFRHLLDGVGVVLQPGSASRLAVCKRLVRNVNLFYLTGRQSRASTADRSAHPRAHVMKRAGLLMSNPVDSPPRHFHRGRRNFPPICHLP